MRVERFFHIRTDYQQGGATVRVVGDTDRVGQVDVQVAHCSRQDPFCRKTGRDTAIAAPIKVVPLRYLPKELGRIEEAVRDRTRLLMRFTDFNYATRYFLPKE